MHAQVQCMCIEVKPFIDIAAASQFQIEPGAGESFHFGSNCPSRGAIPCDWCAELKQSF